MPERAEGIEMGTETSAPEMVPVQCVCGRLKQQGFICDFCFSTDNNRD